MSDQKCVVLNWNVRGLNSGVRRTVVRDLVTDSSCTIVALQETKMSHLTSEIVQETLGQHFVSNFAFLPAEKTRGGALVAVDERYYRITQSMCTEHTVTALIESTMCELNWWITVVYGPQGDQDKIDFLQELKGVQEHTGTRWLLIGDFNLILQARDKSNNNLNRRLMGAFRSLVNDLDLKEINLRGRRYTWSNDTTQTRIDRAFCTIEWEIMLPNATLQALLSLASDHSPLLLVGSATVTTYRGFRFEAF